MKMMNKLLSFFSSTPLVETKTIIKIWYCYLNISSSFFLYFINRITEYLAFQDSSYNTLSFFSTLPESASICRYILQQYTFLLWIEYGSFLEETLHMLSSDLSSLLQSLFSSIFPRVVFQFPFLCYQKSS